MISDRQKILLMNHDQQRTIELADCRRHMETRPYVLELRFFLRFITVTYSNYVLL